MKILRTIRHLFRIHFLLASTATLIFIAFLGSVNIYFISMHSPNLYWMTLLLIALMATMRFLALFLARFPVSRIFEAAITGVLIQIILFFFIRYN